MAIFGVATGTAAVRSQSGRRNGILDYHTPAVSVMMDHGFGDGRRDPMRRSFLTLTLAVLLIVRAPLVHADDLLLDRFRDYLASLRVQAGIPGLAAAIVGTTDIVWERAYGQQDVARNVAMRTDTPLHLDGLTQVFTASMLLRCVEEGQLSLDDRIGELTRGGPDANATVAQLLTHTSGAPESLVFEYRPERLAPFTVVVRACAIGSYRKTLSNLLDRLAMDDSVPGPDVTHIVPPAEGIPTPAAAAHYASVLERLATPYAVDRQGRLSPSQSAATTLTPASGIISSVRDLAKFDVALRRGVLLRADTLAVAWRAPVGRSGQALPHGLGWFVQSYGGQTVVWQFGVGDNASSSLVVTAPARGLTLILLANSDGLAKPFGLAAGDLTVSPFARVFLELFVR